jgi:hypothetical protein
MGSKVSCRSCVLDPWVMMRYVDQTFSDLVHIKNRRQIIMLPFILSATSYTIILKYIENIDTTLHFSSRSSNDFQNVSIHSTRSPNGGHITSKRRRTRCIYHGCPTFSPRRLDVEPASVSSTLASDKNSDSRPRLQDLVVW